MGRHRVSKIHFTGGRDKSRRSLKQLVKNFIRDGKITSTKKRITVLRPKIEILVSKAKKGAEADKTHLLRYLSDKKEVLRVQKQIAPIFKDRVGGYVRLIKLSRRNADGAEMVRMEWTMPIVKEVVQEEIKKEENVTKETKTNKNKSKK